MRTDVREPEDEASEYTRRAIRQTVGLAGASLLITALVAVVCSWEVARRDALGEAERNAQSIAAVVFTPALEGLLTRQPESRQRVDREVAYRTINGSILRAVVWVGGPDQSGTIVYSSDPGRLGISTPLPPGARDALDRGRSSAQLITAGDERAQSGNRRIVETFAPLRGTDGRPFALEIESSDQRVVTAEDSLLRVLLPGSLLLLLILEMISLPVAIARIRQVASHRAERVRLVRHALEASDRERRLIATQVHDGVVQDLTGVGYLLDSLQRSTPFRELPDQARNGLETASTVVREAIDSLRNLMVDIYPPAATPEALPEVIDELAARLRATGVDVAVQVGAGERLDEQGVALLHRATREALKNIDKHAQARHAWVTLGSTDSTTTLTVEDDGQGMSSDTDPRPEGHIGLRLLRDAVADLGGRVDLTDREGGGMRLRVLLPNDACNKPATRRPSDPIVSRSVDTTPK
jgi:signal transduction histidine kinase